MQGKEAVVFKGNRGGVSVQVDRDAPLGAVVDELRRKLSAAENFFQGASVRIELGERPPDPVEQRVLRELIQAHGLSVVDDTGATPPRAVNGHVPRPHADGAGGGARGQAGPAIGGGALAPERGGHDGAGEPCLLVRRTLRSGQRLEFDGSVVVLGDINPGAVVVASGNVVVFGSLRGVVHAGARGDTDARVIALRLQPTQLRIAHLISRSPDGQVPGPSGPEMALVQDERIQIEAYVP